MLLRFATTALLLVTAAGTARALTPAELKDALGRTVARYESLRTFHTVGESRVTVGDGGMGTISVPTVVAGAPGGRLRIELKNPMMSTTIVMDGAHTWIYSSQSNQYMKQPSDNTGDDPSSARARLASTPLGRYFQLAEPARNATLLGERTLTAAGAPRKVWVVAADYPKPDGFQGELEPFVFWIDRESHTVWRDSLTMKVPNPAGGGLVDLVQITDWTSFEPTAHDSLFTFTPPEGAQAAQMPQAPVSPLVDKPAIEFTLADLAGKSRALSSYRGKVVMLDFWATWCGPCRRSMPDLQKLQSEFGAKGLQVLSVNLREEPKTIQPYLDKSKLTLKVLLDKKGEVAAQYGASGIPTLVIIDRKGVVRAWYQGLQSESTLREALAKAGL